ncbi:MAG: XTP/dITP diphosphatase [Deltaproteobacteria bacterium]|nr:XTP/dITP diphosphatase [Deltaproteobacteria bacterium]
MATRGTGWPPRLVFATGNRGKLREVARILAPAGVTVVGIADVAPEWRVVEDGATFAANARLKAESLTRRTGLPALGDDSGLEVAALGGRPGVRSARYAGAHATDAENTARLLGELADVPDDARAAAFRCALVLAWPDGRSVEAEGRCEGVIARTPRGAGGFGYDPVFVDPASGRTFAELPTEAKNAFSHRRRALDALARALAARP